MSDLVGNPEDRFSHKAQFNAFYHDQKATLLIKHSQLIPEFTKKTDIATSANLLTRTDYNQIQNRFCAMLILKIGDKIE